MHRQIESKVFLWYMLCESIFMVHVYCVAIPSPEYVLLESEVVETTRNTILCTWRFKGVAEAVNARKVRLLPHKLVRIASTLSVK